MSKATPQPKRTSTQQQIADALEVTITRTRPSMGYQLGLTATGLMMMLLPLIYMGLIALIAHTIWWMCLRVQSIPGAGKAWYIIGICIVSIILFFLLKPIFRMWTQRNRQVRLKRESEPFLFDYVEQVCKAVNAPVPKSIRLDCEANASASLRRGLWSLFRNDLSLTIGLPLIAGLSVRQMTGVLAHEFGHFSQGYGMRLNALTSTINYWFVRAAYERDQWDYRLVSASHNSDLRIGIFIYLARLFLWLMRQLLAFVAILGQAICCFMSRQMEYDADQFETRLVGSKTFGETCQRLTSISVARQMATYDLSNFYDEGRLADNFPRLIVSNIPFIPNDYHKHVRKFERDQKTAWYDTHPTNRDRIAAAQEQSTDGEFNLPEELGKLPATVLFRDFDKLSKSATIRFYKDHLGDDFNKKTVKKTKKLIQKRDDEHEAGKALDRYFQTHISLLRPLRLADDVETRPEKPREIVAQLEENRKEMLKLVDDYETCSSCLEEAQNSWVMASEAFVLLSSQLRFKPQEFRLKSTRKKDIKLRLKQTNESVRHLQLEMLAYEDLVEERLSHALQLLCLPGVKQRVEGGDVLRIEIKRLIPSCHFVSKMMTKVPDLVLATRKLSTLLPRLDKKNRPDLYQSIEMQMREIHLVLTDIYQELEGEHYPFDHEDATVSLRQYALPEVPDIRDLVGLISASQYVSERLAGVQVRLFSKLAHAAEKVESIVGLPPLPKRKKKEQKRK